MSARLVLNMRHHLCRQAGSSLLRTEPLSARISSPAPCLSSVFVRYQSVQVPPLEELHATPIPIPQPSGVQKDYPPKIVELVDQISGLTLVEVADLTELLKKHLKIPDQAFMGSFSAGPVVAAVASEDEAPKKKEKTTFTVRLTKFDDAKKVPLIKEIKTIVEGLNLVQAKKYVETLPQVVRSDIPKEEAEKLKAQLEAAGGTVELA
ncbi:putative 39S ribosomal protein L12, mitochondrial [Hypsibius exemplaris]|uniref:39S ribosomal protein L12, mitochondrial n=1 Tax=Hypsibius exemplaris TaxID=2072580 RepID=A0A1W0WD81_HYPEX|nr:putative 39S ribosomal protein L12, mitochondrial [Hypsibius exemplaris]